MPQVDFREIFSRPSENRAANKDGLRSEVSPPSEPSSVINSVGFSRSQWTNIAFVVCASVGALVCALYVFKGAEFLRPVRGKLAEPSYHRSDPLLEQRSTQQLAPPSSATPTSTGTADHSGDPFARNTPYLTLAPPPILSPEVPNRSAANPSLSPNSFLRQLSLPAPGGDALSRGLTQGTVDSKVGAIHTATAGMKITAHVTRTVKAQIQSTLSATKKNVVQQSERRSAHDSTQPTKHVTINSGHQIAEKSTRPAINSGRPSVNTGGFSNSSPLGGIRGAGMTGASSLTTAVRGR
jgi:hypothetical protein